EVCLVCLHPSPHIVRPSLTPHTCCRPRDNRYVLHRPQGKRGHLCQDVLRRLSRPQRGQSTACVMPGLRTVLLVTSSLVSVRGQRAWSACVDLWSSWAGAHRTRLADRSGPYASSASLPFGSVADCAGRSSTWVPQCMPLCATVSPTASAAGA